MESLRTTPIVLIWAAVGLCGISVVAKSIIDDAAHSQMFDSPRFLKIVGTTITPPMLVQTLAGAIISRRSRCKTRATCYFASIGTGVIAPLLYCVLLLGLGLWISALGYTRGGRVLIVLLVAFPTAYWWVFVATAVIGGVLAGEYRWRSGLGANRK